MESKRKIYGEILKDQAITNLELLYDELIGGEEYLMRDIEERKKAELKVRYRSDRERLAAGDHICLNCRYWVDSKCTSKKFKENENIWTMECIAEHYKYWEER